MLNIKAIDFSYGTGFNLHIRQLAFAERSITGIVGKNGSGKTTLLNLVAGHLLTRESNIELDNINIAHLHPAERPIATVFQQLALFPHLTVQDNIALGVEPNRLWGFSKKAIERTKEILVEFDLMDFSMRRATSLSIGQQQRVAIARAVSCNPKVLLLDEPTSALDFANIKFLKGLLKRIKAKVATIIVVSHDLPFIIEVADNIKFIDRGNVEFEGSVEQFKSSVFFTQNQ